MHATPPVGSGVRSRRNSGAGSSAEHAAATARHEGATSAETSQSRKAAQRPQGLTSPTVARLARGGTITIRKVIHIVASGTIKTIIPAKGFGFISTAGSGSNELFFHSSSVVGTEFDSLQVGQSVTFEQEPDPRDPSRSRAKNVRLSGDEA